MELGRDVIALVHDFLVARGKIIRIDREPVPWKAEGGLFLVATLPGMSVRILVDPAVRGWQEAVSVAPGAADKEPTDVVLWPAAGADSMLAAWPEALALAASIDADKTT